MFPGANSTLGTMIDNGNPFGAVRMFILKVAHIIIWNKEGLGLTKLYCERRHGWVIHPFKLEDIAPTFYPEKLASQDLYVAPFWLVIYNP